MAGLSDQYEDNVAAYFGDGSWLVIEQSSQVYAWVALCEGDPGNTTNSPTDEVSDGSGYSRQQLLQTGWDAAASGSIDNNAVVSWTASGNWSSAVTHWMLCTVDTNSGAYGLSGALTGSVTVLNGDVVKFKAGDLVVEIVANGLFTYTGGNAFLDRLIRDSGSGTIGTGGYYALSTSTPVAAGTGFTEPVGGSYARVANNPVKFPGTATGSAPASVSNDLDITWPEATGSWGTLTYWGIYDASTSGNLLAFGALDSSQAVGSGDQIKFGIGDLTVTLE